MDLPSQTNALLGRPPVPGEPDYKVAGSKQGRVLCMPPATTPSHPSTVAVTADPSDGDHH